MKLHKLISRTVLATALLGATIGGTFVGFNASVSAGTNPNDVNSDPHVSGTNGDINKTDTLQITKNGSNNNSANINGSRQSEIGANVQDGTLTLDAVPNLGFGNNNKNNDSSTLKLNTNNNGYIKVTDNRNLDADSNTSNRQGWNLSANIDTFDVNGSSVNSNDEWVMHLNPNNTQGIQNDDSPDAKPTINQNISLKAGNNAQSDPIINANGANAGYGTNIVQYSNNDDAHLDIPNVKKGSYTTQMHWKLNTNVGSYNTGYGD